VLQRDFLESRGFLRPKLASGRVSIGGGLSWLERDADQDEGQERSQDVKAGI